MSGGSRFGDDVRIGLRFLTRLPGFLRSPLTAGQARTDVARRLADRPGRFLSLFRGTWLGSPDHPYSRLMKSCGCELEDVARMLRQEGLEGTLTQLFRNGIYLTGDEFKGRVPVERGSCSFTVDPAALIRPGAVVHGLTETSGSRGVRTPVPLDLAFIRDHAINTRLTLEAHGGPGWVHAHWGVPGGTSVTNPLEFAKAGSPPERWFTPVDPGAPGLHPRYRLGSWAMWIGSRLVRVPMPGPTLAPLDDPEPIVRWMAEVLARGDTPHLWTFASSAVLVSQAARRLGVDIVGARFTAGGEPTTAARRRAIEEVGAVVLPRMGATETDILSYACVQADAPDDMHFFHDRHAVIQPGDHSAESGLPPDALLLTSLLPTAPLLLLNVCMGDQARLARRSCGCGMEQHGWDLHISNVRSFEKLTAGGITFLDTDVIRVLEEVLPTRFGGSPTDYQLIERLDAEDGLPRVELAVHPALGPLDPRAIGDAFLEAIGGGSGGERLMELQWRGGRILRVVREPPGRTASGKILHLHVDRD